ncbi:MAG TPA: polysaccharide lyase family 1 protein [Rhodocyclaceae bacterium]|nr:polysaccharide lyase family 1 protein [Rhodocyclaceae bacterium]
MSFKVQRVSAAVSLLLLVAACGGGSGGDGGSTAAANSSNSSSSAASAGASSTTSSSSSSAIVDGGSSSSAASSVAPGGVAPGSIDAKTLTDTAAAPINGWSGFSTMGARSYLAASDPKNTAGHVATATPAPGTPTAYPVIATDPSGGALTFEREVAPASGWHAFYRKGDTVGNHQAVTVTGGSSAVANRIYTCGTKKCIFDAIKEAKNEPKIIRVFGNIDMRVDDDGVFRDFTSWDDQKASSIVLPSNTTLVGINAPDGSPARLISVQIEIGKEFPSTVNSSLVDYEYWIKTLKKPQEDYPGWTRNVIVRNLWLQTNYDVQPEGSSDAYYDGMVVAMAQQVWIDHVTITDGQYKDKDLSGTRHDGALDIVRGSDYVSVTNSAFIEHGKTTLVSNSDSGRQWSDENRFHVTFHDNYYKDTAQRIPRVRWGQVHVFNNYVSGDRDSTTAHEYEGGVGVGYKGDVLVESTLWFVEPTKATEACSKIVVDHGSGTSFRQSNTWLKSVKYLPAGLDVSATLATCGLPSVNLWTPPYSYSLEATPLNLECRIPNTAGAGKIGMYAVTSTGCSSVSSSVSSSAASSAGSSTSTSTSTSTSSSSSAAGSSSSAGTSSSSSSAGASSSSSSAVAGVTGTWSEAFTAADATAFFSTTYASAPGSSSIPMYVKGGGTITVAPGQLILNGGRFTIGALGSVATTGSTGTPPLVTPGGVFTVVGKTCTVSFVVSTAGTGTGKKFQILVDNNGTSASASPHGAASKILDVDVTTLVAGSYSYPIGLTTAGFTSGSFLQFRTESGATVGISSAGLICS